MTDLVRCCGIVTARCLLSAWVGAAVLFVIDGVRLVTAAEFGSVERDLIALLRFPPYYATGATCLLLAAAGLMVARIRPGLGRTRWTVALALTLLAGVTMLVDYLWVYRPLAAMITPPGSVRPATFSTLHRVSETINAVQLGLSIAAACVTSWPLRRGP